MRSKIGMPVVPRGLSRFDNSAFRARRGSGSLEIVVSKSQLIVNYPLKKRRENQKTLLFQAHGLVRYCSIYHPNSFEEIRRFVKKTWQLSRNFRLFCFPVSLV